VNTRCDKTRFLAKQWGDVVCNEENLLEAIRSESKRSDLMNMVKIIEKLNFQRCFFNPQLISIEHHIKGFQSFRISFTNV